MVFFFVFAGSSTSSSSCPKTCLSNATAIRFVMKLAAKPVRIPTGPESRAAVQTIFVPKPITAGIPIVTSLEI